MSLVTDGASFTPAVRHFADAGDRLSARTAPDAEADASLSRAPGWTRAAVLVLRLLCSRLAPKLCVCFSLEVSSVKAQHQAPSTHQDQSEKNSSGSGVAAGELLACRSPDWTGNRSLLS